jgi:hypothetical protein
MKQFKYIFSLLLCCVIAQAETDMQQRGAMRPVYRGTQPTKQQPPRKRQMPTEPEYFVPAPQDVPPAPKNRHQEEMMQPVMEEEMFGPAPQDIPPAPQHEMMTTHIPPAPKTPPSFKNPGKTMKMKKGTVRPYEETSGPAPEMQEEMMMPQYSTNIPPAPKTSPSFGTNGRKIKVKTGGTVTPYSGD